MNCDRFREEGEEERTLGWISSQGGWMVNGSRGFWIFRRIVVTPFAFWVTSVVADRFVAILGFLGKLKKAKFVKNNNRNYSIIQKIIRTMNLNFITLFTDKSSFEVKYMLFSNGPNPKKSNKNLNWLQYMWVYFDQMSALILQSSQPLNKKQSTLLK